MQIQDFYYRLSIAMYIIAYSVFLLGWYMQANLILPFILCLPLIAMTPLVIGKRRRYYQFIPNILVLYIGWAIAELFINKTMHLYAAIALVAWSMTLWAMLKLIRTNYLIDGDHYISTRKKKKKR